MDKKFIDCNDIYNLVSSFKIQIIYYKLNSIYHNLENKDYNTNKLMAPNGNINI